MTKEEALAELLVKIDTVREQIDCLESELWDLECQYQRVDEDTSWE